MVFGVVNVEGIVGQLNNGMMAILLMQVQKAWKPQWVPYGG